MVDNVIRVATKQKVLESWGKGAVDRATWMMCDPTEVGPEGWQGAWGWLGLVPSHTRNEKADGEREVQDLGGRGGSDRRGWREQAKSWATGKKYRVWLSPETEARFKPILPSPLRTLKESACEECKRGQKKHQQGYAPAGQQDPPKGG
jgi:hypothetical protein